MLELAGRCGDSTLLLCLFSGGGSALMPAPVPEISLAEKQQTTRELLACGATIGEINAVRKHLSRVKGGRLARLSHPAPTVSLMISDVIGDRLDTIASGPTYPDSTSFSDCDAIFSRYGIESRSSRGGSFLYRRGVVWEKRPILPGPERTVSATPSTWWSGTTASLSGRPSGRRASWVTSRSCCPPGSPARPGKWQGFTSPLPKRRPPPATRWPRPPASSAAGKPRWRSGAREREGATRSSPLPRPCCWTAAKRSRS